MTEEKPTQAGEKRKASTKTEAAPKSKKARGRPKGSKNKVKELTAHVSRDQRLSARKAAADKASKEQEKKKK